MSKENKLMSDLVGKLTQVRALIEEAIAQAGGGAGKSKAAVGSSKRKARNTLGVPHLDFEKPMRAFVKAHANNLSGTKKFVLLVARLAQGDLKKEVPLEEVQKQWKRMTSKSLLGLDFNTFYSTDAREKDWVDSKKKGSYNLRPSWKDIFR